MKKLILIILILTFAVCLNAQQITYKWAESTGGLSNFKCYIEVDKKEVYECSKEQWFKIKIKDKVNLKEFVKVNKKKPEKQKIKIEMYGQGQGYGQNSGQNVHSDYIKSTVPATLPIRTASQGGSFANDTVVYYNKIQNLLKAYQERLKQLEETDTVLLQLKGAILQLQELINEERKQQ